MLCKILGENEELRDRLVRHSNELDSVAKRVKHASREQNGSNERISDNLKMLREKINGQKEFLANKSFSAKPPKLLTGQAANSKRKTKC